MYHRVCLAIFTHIISIQCGVHSYVQHAHLETGKALQYTWLVANWQLTNTYNHRPEELSLSYNGGKDCLVLLILILASLPSHFPSSTSSSDSSSIPPSDTTNTATIPATATTTSATATTTPSFPTTFQALYIRPLSPFPEVDDFVAETTARYHLDLATSDKPMKAALTDYLSSAPIPTQEQQRGDHAHGRGQDVRAVFVGTRRTDPHGQFLTHFDETDRDWPRFMRVHPVIDWHYREVWGVSFFRSLNSSSYYLS